MSIYRKIYAIKGIVQGVGFRPSVYSLAKEKNIGGWIRNSSGKVELAVEGTEKTIESFIKSIQKNLPDHAEIEQTSLLEEYIIEKSSEFQILTSNENSDLTSSLPADLAMCKDCKREITDPNDRRFKYAFTTCTKCGPRYTVVRSMPYDRCRTTLTDFPMCENCEKEYTDPADRRFHAESIACPVCGPHLFILNSEGEKINIDNPLEKAKQELKQGKIVAIKGIGGFLLAANAYDKSTIKRLREKKQRPDKPFAVMAKNIRALKNFTYVSHEEENLLTSYAAPIVILSVSLNKSNDLPINLISPDNYDNIGVMLPYSPLHFLLFEGNMPDVLIMTSGNKGGEPISIKNDEGVNSLKNIADFYLCHNRDINLHNDDSLCIFHGDERQIWRRARGYAPNPIKTKNNTKKTVLAMGAELKNNIALYFNNEVVISPHIGDIANPKALGAMEKIVQNFPSFYKKEPEVIAVDMHPDFRSTRLGKQIGINRKIPVKEVQHHFAHGLSCMTENGLDKALALVFDGTGLGTDGEIWGAELMHIGESGYNRLGTFSSAVLPGGDAAITQPIRQLIARLVSYNFDFNEDFLSKFSVDRDSFNIWKLQTEKNLNCPRTHAAARLFDCVSVLLGCINDKITYEGQPAIKLETLARQASIKKQANNFKFHYKKEIQNDFIYIDWSNLIKNITDIVLTGKDYNKSLIAYYFHELLAEAALDMIQFGNSLYNLSDVVLSGGVFMNRILTRLIKEKAEQKGYNIYIHKNTPPNDGCISLGQAVAVSKTNE